TTNYTVGLVDSSGAAITVGSATDVTVQFVNGTAEAGDYDGANQTVTIAAGSSTATLTVDTVEDADYDNETFTASINNVQDTGEFENIDIVSGANGQTPTQDTTIIDITEPTISINDVTVNEDASFATFTVTISNAIGTNVTFNYDTSNNTATAGPDYDAVVGGTGTITAGNTSTTITVPINDDYYEEGNETYDVTLSNLSANVAAVGNDLIGVGTITDAGSPTPTESITSVDTVYAVISGPANVTEGDTTTNYTVGLVDSSGAAITVGSATDVTVQFVNGTAEAGDYDGANQTVTI
ncbi:MAG: hypothetical protein GY754_41090, partial [bacterium]|nr:hypothetical protein [bacterium]